MYYVRTMSSIQYAWLAGDACCGEEEIDKLTWSLQQGKMIEREGEEDHKKTNVSVFFRKKRSHKTYVKKQRNEMRRKRVRI